MSAFLSSWSGVVAVARRDGDADAGADHDLVAVDVVAARRRVDEALRQRSRRIPACRGRPADRELVAAEAGDRVGVAHAGEQALGHRLEQPSPTGWPSVSLTLLKWSRSRQSTATVSPRADPDERLLHLLAEQHAVRQVGQRVVARHVLDAGLGAVVSVMSSMVATQPPSTIGSWLICIVRPSWSSSR